MKRIALAAILAVCVSGEALAERSMLCEDTSIPTLAKVEFQQLDNGEFLIDGKPAEVLSTSMSGKYIIAWRDIHSPPGEITVEVFGVNFATVNFEVGYFGSGVKFQPLYSRKCQRLD